MKFSLDQARTQLKFLETEQIAQQILYSKQKYFQYAKRPAKGLANLLGQRKKNRGYQVF